jgi:hypothetical protein
MIASAPNQVALYDFAVDYFAWKAQQPTADELWKQIRRVREQIVVYEAIGDKHLLEEAKKRERELEEQYERLYGGEQK